MYWSLWYKESTQLNDTEVMIPTEVKFSPKSAVAKFPGEGKGECAQVTSESHH